MFPRVTYPKPGRAPKFARLSQPADPTDSDEDDEESDPTVTSIGSSCHRFTASRSVGRVQPAGRTPSIAPAARLVALVFVASVALRGYVPDAETTPREPAPDNPLATVVVIGLLFGAVVVVTVAVLARLRNRAQPASNPASRPDWLRRRDRGLPGWRMWLVAFGVILGWLLLASLLYRFSGRGAGLTPSLGPGSSPARAVPAPDSNEAGRTVPPDPGTDWNLLTYFYAASVVFLFVLIAGSVVASHRRSRPVQQTAIPREDHAELPAPEDGAESLVRAAEVGLAEVGDLSREPRKAIIACYAAMERELALLPDTGPRDFDTASEVLARAVDHRALRPDSATQLVDLFDEARFSPHVMNEGHRDTAVAVLTKVLGELRSHV